MAQDDCIVVVLVVLVAAILVRLRCFLLRPLFVSAPYLGHPGINITSDICRPENLSDIIGTRQAGAQKGLMFMISSYAFFTRLRQDCSMRFMSLLRSFRRWKPCRSKFPPPLKKAVGYCVACISACWLLQHNPMVCDFYLRDDQPDEKATVVTLFHPLVARYSSLSHSAFPVSF